MQKLPDTLYIVLQYWVDLYIFTILNSQNTMNWQKSKTKKSESITDYYWFNTPLHVTYFKSMHIVTTNEKNHANEMTLSFILVHI